MMGNIAWFSSADFFFKVNLNSFKNTIRVSIRLDTDHIQYFVDPDLDSNCLQRLSADDKSCHQQAMS